MKNRRNVKKIVTAHGTIDGAGVALNRAIGFDDPYVYDPFLLFDDLRSDNEDDYIKGFPWHPHRGIETITYMLKGEIEHEDSLGNKGKICEGSLQWMTAGSGIYHQEMPVGDKTGKMYGFQLWANLPKKYKMSEPKYRDVSENDIKEIIKKDGVSIKVIAGNYEGICGPINDVVIDPDYYDIKIPSNTEFEIETKKMHTVLFYIYEGSGIILENRDGVEVGVDIANHDMVLFGEGDCVKLASQESELRCIMLSGKPIHEEIAWYGPIVMNTQEELETAYEELEKGTFIKDSKQE